MTWLLVLLRISSSSGGFTMCDASGSSESLSSDCMAKVICSDSQVRKSELRADLSWWLTVIFKFLGDLGDDVK